VGRFLLVGGAATAVALLLFNVLVHGLFVGDALLADRPITAYVVANSIGMLISFHGSRTYAFRDRAPRGSDGGFTAYVAINLATMTIPVLCLALSRDVLGLSDPVSDNVAANIVGAWLGLAARFHLFRTFVFRRPIALTELYDEPQPEVAPVVSPVVSPAQPTGRSTRRRAVPPAA
jgi:putative flippase GtrA